MKTAQWYTGIVDDGRGGSYAIHCRTRRHARARIAEESTRSGYRCSPRSISLLSAGPTPSVEVIAAASLAHRER